MLEKNTGNYGKPYWKLGNNSIEKLEVKIKSEDRKKSEVKNSKFKVQKVWRLGFGKNTDFAD